MLVGRIAGVGLELVSSASQSRHRGRPQRMGARVKVRSMRRLLSLWPVIFFFLTELTLYSYCRWFGKQLKRVFD